MEAVESAAAAAVAAGPRNRDADWDTRAGAAAELLRTGDAAAAERAFRELAYEQIATLGATDPRALETLYSCAVARGGKGFPSWFPHLHCVRVHAVSWRPGGPST
jgi:hypothetical protein